MIVLENDNRPSPNCKGDGEGIAGSVEVKSQKDRLECSENNVSASSHKEGTSNIEVKSQKDRLDCSASYVLVSCHLEMLRHSLSDDLHLTQVSLPSFYQSFALHLLQLAAIVEKLSEMHHLSDLHLTQVSLLHLLFSLSRLFLFPFFTVGCHVVVNVIL